MRLFEIIATHRSGHHSMMNWIIANITGLQCGWEYKMNILLDTGLFQLNCANHDIPISMKLFDEFKSQYKELIVSYEDTHWDYTIFNEMQKYSGKLSLKFDIKNFYEYKRIVFLRNFYDNLASRIKSNQNSNFITFEEKKVVKFDVGEHFIWRWKNNARACVENKVHFLKFEDWLQKPKIRKKFLNEVLGTKEIFNTDNIVGTKSSFENIQNVLNRKEEVEIPQETKKLIREDCELHYLIGKLGYEYTDL